MSGRDPEVEKLLEGYNFILDWPVAWRDCDMLRHVNSIMYFVWFENARVDYGNRIGTVAYGSETGIGPILRDAHMTFRRAMAWPDTVSIGIRVSKIERDRYHMEVRIVSHNLKAVTAEGGCTNVYYDYNKLEKTDIPEALIKQVEDFEGRRLGG